MTSSYTTNKVLEKPGNGDYVDTWNVPVNSDMDVIDQAFGGTTALNATAGSATLTAAQYRSLIITVSGAISGNVVYTIPSGKGGQWIVRNTTTDSSGGPWLITFASGGGGTSVSIPRSLSVIIVSDGTNINIVHADPITPVTTFDSGTVMLFAQTTAPTGWTKSTTHNNKALRVVSGAASSGGSVDFTTAFSSQAVSGTVGDTTLTIDQIPEHTHTTGSFLRSGIGGGGATIKEAIGSSGITSGATGGGQSHTHTFTGTAINLAVAYVDVILAVKN